MPGTASLSELLEYLMTSLDIPPAELAHAMGASDRTFQRWLADERYPQHDARARLDDITGLTRRLGESFTSTEGGAAWLHAPSGYFGGLAPVDALVRGRIDLVNAALDALDAGVFV